ncbi:MAG: RHS repeat-associated core domain-containing protein, partial [Bacteroidales bacterium]|nr:RHS repeat-associated core domain-containing protein [Bacteroidales bacterium]
LVLFPLAGLSKSSRALRGNEHGSMTEMPHLQNMEWDFAERLSHITRGTTEAYYNYDGGGERVRKVVEKDNIVEIRLYLGGFEIFRKKVGNSLELERETLHIMDDTRRISLVETLTVDNGVAVNNATPVQRYQLSNNIESATLELDENANIISYEECYPYGDTSYQAGRSTSEVSQKRYRYTGKEKDEESGLYYHGARYYAAWLGRWTAADPAGLVDGVNLYMYCRGDPVKLMDPSGMTSDKTEVGLKFSEEINTAEELKSYLSRGGTFEYEGMRYFLSFDGELNIEMINGIPTITGENLYAHEVPINNENDDNHMIFEAVNVMPEDELNIYDMPSDNTRIVQGSGGANNGDGAINEILQSVSAPGIINTTISTTVEKIVGNEGKVMQIEANNSRKRAQKRNERLAKQGKTSGSGSTRASGRYNRSIRRNIARQNAAAAKHAAGSRLASASTKGVPIVGATVGGLIEYYENVGRGDSTGLAVSKAGGAVAGSIAAGFITALIISNPVGWGVLAAIGLGMLLGVGLSMFGSWLGGKLYNAFN